MSQEELLKKAFRYRRSNARDKNYRNYYREYKKLEDVDPLTFHSRVLGENPPRNVVSFPNENTKLAARAFSKVYEGEVIRKVRDIARNRGT